MDKTKTQNKNSYINIFKNYINLAFIIIFIYTIISDVYFISLNNVPLSWDPALHMYYSLIYFYLIKTLNFGAIVKVSNYYPPFFHLSSSLLYTIFGFSNKIAILTNIMYYVIFVYSLIKIGEYLDSREAGLISAMVASSFPILLIFQRKYMLDFALTSLVTFTVYMYLKSDKFRNLKYSVLFGLAFGLSELTKWDAFIYILPPVLITFVVDYLNRCPYCQKFVKDGVKKGFRKFCSQKHAKLYDPKKELYLYTNAIISLLVAFVVAAWWYLPNLHSVIVRLTYFANIGGKEGDPTVYTIRGWIYYLKAILNSICVPFLVIFLVSIYYLYKHKKDCKTLTLILSSIVVPYLILTIISNKDCRYIMPVLPFIALPIGIFVKDFANKNNIGKYIFAGILILCILNISAVTFGQPSVDHKILPTPDYPKTEDWKINEILKAIEKSGGNGKIVVTLADHPYLNGQSLEFYTFEKGYKFVVYNGVYLGYKGFVRIFNKIGYIIVIKPRKHRGVYGNIEAKLYEYFYKHIQQFRKIAVFNLPDGSKVYIYKRINS